MFAKHMHWPWFHISCFKFHFFPHLLILLQFRDPLLCTKLIHQSSLAEITYSVQESQIFVVWIDFSPDMNKFKRVFLEIDHVSLDFKLQWWTWPFLMAISCAYVIFFNSQKSYLFSFKRITHSKTKIFMKLKHC